jgi:hypothetical protein
MSIQQVQHWLDAVCNTQAGVADGIVTEAGSAQSAARWTGAAAGDAAPLLRAAQSAIRARQAIVENLRPSAENAVAGGATMRIVALPLLRGAEATGAVALRYFNISADGVDHAVDSLGKACAELMALLDATAPQVPHAAADAVLQIQAAVLSQARADEAAAVLATRLAQWLAFDRVSVGLIEKGYARVLATSHGAAVDARQEQNRLIAAAMDEAIDQQATIILPAAAGAPRITLAHAALCRSGSALACSIPIVHLDAVAGVVTLERIAGESLSSEALERCEHAVSLAC